MKGFIVGNYADDFKQASQDLAQWVIEDKIKTKTTVEEGFENPIASTTPTASKPKTRGA